MAIGKDGYGRFNWFGFDDDYARTRSVTAHRAAWQFVNGQSDPEMVIDHICRNRGCVNPTHLRQLGRGENMLIGVGPGAVNSRKTHCHRGHPLSGPNVYVTANGRSCRACHALRERERRRHLKASRPPKQERTHCSQGHALTPENVYVYRGNKRCKECRRINDRMRYARDPTIREKIVAARRARAGS